MSAHTLGWRKDQYGYAVCLLCQTPVNPNASSMLAHVDAKHRENAK